MVDLSRSAFRAFPIRHSALAALTALLFAAPAHALAPEGEAEREAREAQQVLSDRYTAAWATLGAGERARFAQAERHWLHHTRWAQQRQCIATATSATATATATDADAAELSARCLAEVTRQRAQRLAQPALAAR
ncbi:MAG: hypothetical protein ACK56N_08620 [Betaproteobacteria bacterium]|jgi:hypothetical protein